MAVQAKNQIRIQKRGVFGHYSPPRAEGPRMNENLDIGRVIWGEVRDVWAALKD